MMFLTHSDNWHWQPPIPPSYYRGWYIENDDGEPIIGPFKTETEAQEELQAQGEPA
jgi:hypothetical protein